MIQNILGVNFADEAEAEAAGTCCCCCNCDGNSSEYKIGDVDGHAFIRIERA